MPRQLAGGAAALSEAVEKHRLPPEQAARTVGDSARISRGLRRTITAALLAPSRRPAATPSSRTASCRPWAKAAAASRPAPRELRRSPAEVAAGAPPRAIRYVIGMESLHKSRGGRRCCCRPSSSRSTSAAACAAPSRRFLDFEAFEARKCSFGQLRDMTWMCGTAGSPDFVSLVEAPGAQTVAHPAQHCPPGDPRRPQTDGGGGM